MQTRRKDWFFTQVKLILVYSLLVALSVIVSNWLEVYVGHCVFWRHTLSMVVSEHLTKQVESFITDELIVLRIDKFGPCFARNRSWQQVIVDLVESEAVLVEVGVEFFGAEDLGNLYELVVVVAALEEGLPLEDHASEHAAEGPDV